MKANGSQAPVATPSATEAPTGLAVATASAGPRNEVTSVGPAGAASALADGGPFAPKKPSAPVDAQRLTKPSGGTPKHQQGAPSIDDLLLERK
jgi:hypothetical protein